MTPTSRRRLPATRLAALASAAALALAACGGPGGGPSPSPSPSPSPAAPSAPAVTLAFAIKQVVLTWPAVPGATSYSVQGGTGTTQATGEVQYAWTTLADGQTGTRHAFPVALHVGAWWPFFRVAACNSTGCTFGDVLRAGGGLEQLHTVGYVKASDPVRYAQLGSAVSLSVDGNTLAVGAEGQLFPAGAGAPGYDLPGAVYVYRRDPATNTWAEQQRITQAAGSGGDRFGRIVSLSGDGATLAVGAPWEGWEASFADSRNGRGAVHVFAFDGSAWREQARFSQAGAEVLWFGNALSLSADGRTLAVADPGDAVWVYAQGAGGWSAGGTKLVSGDAVDPERRTSQGGYGEFVALSGDGTQVAVSQTGKAAMGGGGVVHTYALGEGGWIAGAVLGAPANTSDFGLSVALSADGATLMAGTAGAGVYVYWRAGPGTRWDDGTVTTWHAGGAGGPVAARPVYALSADGRTIAGSDALGSGGVSAATCEVGRCAWGTVHLREPGELLHSRYQGGHLFGSALALSGDGRTLAVGAPAESNATPGVGVGSQQPNGKDPDHSGAAFLY